jgi:hypothetical protein
VCVEEEQRQKELRTDSGEEASAQRMFHKENPRRNLWRRGGESTERGDHTHSWLPGQLAGRVRAAQKTNMNPIFKHLARRKTIDVKKICFFKRYVFLFMAISILPYSNII